MVNEFKRFKLSRYRRLTGVLELHGGLGQLLGFYFSGEIYIFSTVGLATLMLLGVVTRVKIKDRWYEILPAFILLLLNTYIAYEGIKFLG